MRSNEALHVLRQKWCQVGNTERADPLGKGGKRGRAGPGVEWGSRLRKLENLVLRRVKACRKSDLMVKRELVEEQEEIHTFLLSLVGPMSQKLNRIVLPDKIVMLHLKETTFKYYHLLLIQLALA